MLSRFLCLLVLLCASLTLTSAYHTRHLERDDMTGHVPSSAEELLATRERRRKEFSRKLNQFQRQLEQHEQGQRPLQDFEVQRLKRKIRAYSEKVEFLSQELTDDHIDRLLMREEILNDVHRARISRSEL